MTYTSIGIDLSTDYKVGHWRNGEVESIPNEFHVEKKMVSSVSGLSFPNIKRILDEINKQELQCNGDNFFGEAKLSKFMEKLQVQAEKILNTKINSCVVSIPSYFTDYQRLITKSAAENAGLSVDLITDPLAASIWYDFHKDESAFDALVLDFGRNGLSISLISFDDHIMEVFSTAGDSQLGGEYFDLILLDHFIKEFELKHPNEVLHWNLSILQRLKNSCEQAKIILSLEEKASIEINNLINGHDFSFSITREAFEILCNDPFDRFHKLVKRVLRDGYIYCPVVKKVILAGGSSYIPKIRQILKVLVGNIEFVDCSDNCVAFGAAVFAGITSGCTGQILDQILCLDTTCYSIGTETDGKLMSHLISRNTHFPTNVTLNVTTFCDNQSKLSIKIFEGERGLTKDNNFLGTIKIFGICKAPRGVPIIDVSYQLDKNGIFTCIASEKSGPKHSITTVFERKNLELCFIESFQ